MKINFKNISLALFAATMLTGCVGEDDTTLPSYNPIQLSQKFEGYSDNTLLDIPGWLNYAESGSALWRIQVYSSNGYAEFNPYSSGDATNIGWLVSPAFSLPEGSENMLSFKVSQSYVTSTSNSLKVYISTDFDGTNVSSASWQQLDAEVPGTDAEYFEFQQSLVDLSDFAGAENLYLAFKVTGSGTNTALDGSYQIDNVTVY